jgi:predicted RNase H-like HicB family nuclease
MQYIGLIHKDAGSDYGVSFPDFPGCITAGTTLEEARVMAQEALSLHVEGLIEDGEPLPAPTSLDEILADPENRDTIAVLAIAPARSSKAVRVNITIPEDVLAKIDAYAREQGLTRSGLLTRAAQRVLEEV